MEIYPNFNIEKMNSEDKQLTLDKRYIRMALIWAGKIHIVNAEKSERLSLKKK